MHEHGAVALEHQQPHRLGEQGLQAAGVADLAAGDEQAHGQDPRPARGRSGTASLAGVATVIPIEELRRSPQSALFQGRDEAPISIFINEFERGKGPRLHLHPYPETFVVQAGSARFTAGDEEIEVGAGHLVVVPAETPHRFEGTSDEKVRTVSVHPSPTVVQTDL